MKSLGWALEILALILLFCVIDSNPVPWKVGVGILAIGLGIYGAILRSRANRRKG